MNPRDGVDGPLFLKPLNHTAMGLFLFVIIDPNKEQIALIMRQAVKVFLVPDLVYGTFGGGILFQFYDHGRTLGSTSSLL